MRSRTVAQAIIIKKFAKIEYFHDDTKKIDYFADAHKDFYKIMLMRHYWKV